MGIAGEIEFFGRGDDYAGAMVDGSIQTYVRAVIDGRLRETYWLLGDGSATSGRTRGC